MTLLINVLSVRLEPLSLEAIRFGNKVSVSVEETIKTSYQYHSNQLTQMIQYKSEEVGINVILQNESHTSKCSFLDLESVKHHDKYKGKRTSRSLFRSKKGTLIHSDVNGAYNIIRKAKPNAFHANGVGGCGLHPLKVILHE